MSVKSDNKIIDRAAAAIRWFYPACSAPTNYGHGGPGHYVWSIDYPDEGSVRVGPPSFKTDQLVRIAEIIVAHEREDGGEPDPLHRLYSKAGLK